MTGVDALPSPAPEPSGPDALRRRAAHDLDILAYPRPDWVRPVASPDGTEVLDCAVIGAGQYGLTLTHGLLREKVTRVAAFDAAAPGEEGPWATFARMAMLRTPKDLTGPDLGIPSLSFRAWWEARHGRESWDAMFRIPREAWMDYLNWYRQTLDLPVRNGWRLAALEPAHDGTLLRLSFDAPGSDAPNRPRTVHARTVLLATGASAVGRAPLPPAIAAAVPPDRLFHANDPFDPAVLAGLRVGVLGAGASGFDVCVAALRAGARSADLCFRRPALPRLNPRRWMENAGHLAHYVDLPDARKWATMRMLGEIGQGPPQPTYDAAVALPGFALHPATPWDDIRWIGGEIIVSAGGRTLAFDVAVIATGMGGDPLGTPELAAVARHAARWSDRFAPPPGDESAALALSPHLDRFGAFTERVPGEAPWLARIFTAARGCTLSLGPVAASNSAMKYVAPRLIEGVKRRLFLDQEEADWAALLTHDHTEIVG